MTWDEEERHAWDLYAASYAERYTPIGAANTADLLLEERRKRFPRVYPTGPEPKPRSG